MFNVMTQSKNSSCQQHLKLEQEYIPRGQNILQQIFKDHFDNFKEQYDEKYAKSYGNYRIDRITEVVEEFLKCGNFKDGVARIKCQNPECGHDYFVPLSCLSFYLCPSCPQHTLRSNYSLNKVIIRNAPYFLENK